MNATFGIGLCTFPFSAVALQALSTSWTADPFDRIIYALGGTTPLNFLKAVGIKFEGEVPVLTEGYETSLPGLYLIGDLSAGKKGGSINLAFNMAADAMRHICTCPLPTR